MYSTSWDSSKQQLRQQQEQLSSKLRLLKLASGHSSKLVTGLKNWLSSSLSNKHRITVASSCSGAGARKIAAQLHEETAGSAIGTASSRTSLGCYATGPTDPGCATAAARRAAAWPPDTGTQRLMETTDRTAP